MIVTEEQATEEPAGGDEESSIGGAADRADNAVISPELSEEPTGGAVDGADHGVVVITPELSTTDGVLEEAAGGAVTEASGTADGAGRKDEYAEQRQELFRNLINGYCLIIFGFISKRPVKTLIREAIVISITGTFLVPMVEFLIYKIFINREIKNIISPIIVSTLGLGFGAALPIVFLSVFPFEFKPRVAFIGLGIFFPLVILNWERDL